MHIQSYLGQFNSFSSKEQRQMQTIFSNLNRSRKSLTKLYQHKPHYDSNTNINPFKIPKKDQYAFDDNLFQTLYQSNPRPSHQRNNTVSGKVDVSKLSFKLNYVENHRPIIKQKIITKAKEKQEPFNANFLTQPKTQLKIQTKRSNIQKFIKNHQDLEESADFVRSRKPNQISIKDALQKMQNNQSPKNSQYQTLLPRRIQSSNTHYDLHYQNVKNSQLNRYQNPQKGKEKASSPGELPDYAKNIMKPCKIKGIELIDRPLSMAIKKKLSSLGGNTMKLRDSRPGYKGSDQTIEWSLRVVKTARESGRIKKSMMAQPDSYMNSRTPQNKDNKRLIIPEPWNIDLNDEEQEPILMFNHRTIN